MILHIVQPELDGIPQEPDIYVKKQDADKHWKVA